MATQSEARIQQLEARSQQLEAALLRLKTHPLLTRRHGPMEQAAAAIIRAVLR